MTETPILQKLEAIRDLLRGLKRVAVALSGGVDSAFVLRAALDTLGAEGIVAFTGRSESLSAEELETAIGIAAGLGIRHFVLETDELSRPGYVQNAPDRCYHCKTTLYEHAQRAPELVGYVIVNGTNADDLGDWRPGLRAAGEHGVRAPAAEVGLTKAEIRLLSREWGLPTADKPASPCLSSRIAYGELVTPEKLRMIEQAERFLRNLGLREFRVRLHGDALARIEVPLDWIVRLASDDLRGRIEAHFRGLGYHYVTLDLRGFRSGSMNEVIALGVDAIQERRASPPL